LTLTGAGNINGTGNASDNVIVGNSGNNALSGGAGQDTLTGGTGKDRFAYTATADTGTTAATADIITDFATVNAVTLANSDLINVNAIDANTGVGGNQNFAFIGTADFSAAGQIRYVQIGADTFIEGNVNAGLGADFSIQLSGLHVLGATDFLL
jgi:Ca2+-binding RTX toxin-like protein